MWSLQASDVVHRNMTTLVGWTKIRHAEAMATPLMPVERTLPTRLVPARRSAVLRLVPPLVEPPPEDVPDLSMAHTFARVLIEVLQRRRPRHHITTHAPADVAVNLRTLLDRDTDWELVSVHPQAVGLDTWEMSLHVAGARTNHAVACRIQRQGTAWVCEALSISP